MSSNLQPWPSYPKYWIYSSLLPGRDVEEETEAG